jgi:hypothetical protein
LTLAPAGQAQIDPEKRRLLEFGYNQPTQGRGPIAGYAFFYYNEPQFIRTNLTLRLAIAPVYLDSELGIGGALSPRTDLALGVAGGGFADSYSEIRQGNLFREESFTGHAAEVNASIYHLFNPGDRIPLSGVFRLAGHFTRYERDDRTDAAFDIPEDQEMLHVRGGLRWGGRAPSMGPEPALELSAWYEGAFRAEPTFYGYSNDRNLQASSHLFWTRALFAYRLPEANHAFEASITAGATIRADRLSAYRIGASLPLVAEYPLNLPGYYFQELTASRFILASGQYEAPLNPAKTLSLVGYAATAVIDYVRGLDQSGHWHSGVGGGFAYEPAAKSWKLMLGYAYGIDAIRDGGRGAHSVGLLFQYDFVASPQKLPSFLNPNKWRGFDRIFGR